MNFKKWCRKVLGIVEFTEGKILNCKLIPAVPNEDIKITQQIEKAGAYILDSPNMRGIIIPHDSYLILKGMLQRYFASSKLDLKNFPQWFNHYFLNIGVDLTQAVEYKDPSSIHITFQNEIAQNKFLARFHMFYPMYSFNPLSSRITIQMPASFINNLQNLYYSDPRAEIKIVQNYALLQKYSKNLHHLRQLIDRHQLHARLDHSALLARDFTNCKANGVSLKLSQAASAYALSLKVYAEVNRDNISFKQYAGLNYAASLLAAYTPEGQLKQSLKTDSKFVGYVSVELVEHYLGDTFTECPLLRNLPEKEQFFISSQIEHNMNAMLYGSPCVALGTDAHISTLRFLPNRKMDSDTDELIFQGGGMRGHSAIFRIIKVGVLANGTKAAFNEKPLFYEYYKVENNLGTGCHELNGYDKTCTGTYVTKLIPFAIQHNLFIPVDIDPYLQTVEYQHAMEFTLKELIRVERQLMFYRKPSFTRVDGTYSSPESEEANEWYRLNYVKRCLNGRPYPLPINYYSQDPLEPTKYYERVVCNQRSFSQEGGSCPIFSLKSLVSSIIGVELTTLHNNFMQLNNSQQHLSKIDEKIALLQLYISQLSPNTEYLTGEETQTVSRSFSQNKNTFFGVNQSEADDGLQDTGLKIQFTPNQYRVFS